MRIAGGTAKRITRRIINFILVIWGVVTLSFCLQVFTGTDPAEMIVRKVNVFATEEQIQACLLYTSCIAILPPCCAALGIRCFKR